MKVAVATVVMSLIEPNALWAFSSAFIAIEVFGFLVVLGLLLFEII
jgi:hypothetical protein